MQQADVMGGGDAVKRLAREPGKIIERKRGARRYRLECFALDQLHHHIRTAIVHAEVVHADDVRMLQRGKMSGLRDGARIGLALYRARRNNPLQRDFALQLSIPRPINFTQTAGGNQTAEFVSSRGRRDAPDTSSGGEFKYARVDV